MKVDLFNVFCGMFAISIPLLGRYLNVCGLVWLVGDDGEAILICSGIVAEIVTIIGFCRHNNIK